MKNNVLPVIFILSLVFFPSCKDNEQTAKPENDLDAARGFIRSTMDGDYKKARNLMLQDSTNTQFLDVFERNYNERMSREDKEGYRVASINVHELNSINDSTSVISYSNSYFKNDTHYLKVLKVNDRWLVDLKYYFEPKKDSLP